VRRKAHVPPAWLPFALSATRRAAGRKAGVAAAPCYALLNC
jgi:hypothetical protein